MKIRKKIQIAFLFYLQNNYLSMAKGSNEFGTSLLSKCYPNGVLPPEIDGEGNIEYKVKKKNKVNEHHTRKHSYLLSKPYIIA